MNKTTAIIVGAGWAGISAAVKLAEAGILVTVLEAAPKAGGRARSITFDGDSVDNGQHILLGAYEHTLKLFKTIGNLETEFLLRRKNRLVMYDLAQQKTALDLKLPNYFPPLHMIAAILFEKNLPLKDRIRALRFCRTLRSLNFEIDEDISVLELLNHHLQTPLLIHTLWEPLALAALSTPIAIASAQVFLKVLRNAFTQHTHSSDFLFSKKDLSEILPNPALAYLKKKGGEITYHQRVERLHIEHNQCRGVETRKQTLKADYVILTTPPDITAHILENTHTDLFLETLIRQLKAFSYQTITTIYLRYAMPVNLPYHMLGVLNGNAQWIFDRAFANQPNIVSVIITEQRSVLQNSLHKNNINPDLENNLIKKLTDEIAQIFPHLAFPLQAKIIRDKRAAFTCTPNINRLRPDNATNLPNLFLAGDYTNTGYPATLEGAVISGSSAASLICLNLDLDNSS